MDRFDIAIIGAGPAGSSAAILLARRGYSVALFDKEEFPRDKLCGDFLNPSCWPLFTELGIGDDLLAADHENINSFRITCAAGAEVVIALAGVNGTALSGLGLRRFFFDDILFKKAAVAGVTTLPKCRAKNLFHQGQGWRIEYDHKENSAALEAKILLGADGRNSWVANQLGLNRDGAHRGRAVGFQLRLKHFGGLGGRVEIHQFPGGYAGLVGLGDGTLNLGLAADRRQLGQELRIDTLLESHLPRNPYLQEILRHSEPIGAVRSAYPVYFPARRAHANGVVLIGDAARVNEPITGEGIFFALRSAAMAAATIDQALRSDDVSASRLSAYTRSCQSEFRRRRALNGLIRYIIYRPALLSPLLRLSRRNEFFLEPLVHAICTPEYSA
jgi:menaquinone-9 beta-reductase